MVKSTKGPLVVYDPTAAFTQKTSSTSFSNGSDINLYNNDDTDIRKLLKDVEKLGVAHMPWKDRKKYENRKVVELGGKPTKTNRIPLSIARPALKKKQRREEKKTEEEKILGLFKKTSKNNRKDPKIKPEDRVLRSTEGHFRNGVLDVKHLFAPKRSKDIDMGPERKIKKKGKRKGKGKGQKRGKQRGRK